MLCLSVCARIRVPWPIRRIHPRLTSAGKASGFLAARLLLGVRGGVSFCYLKVIAT